MKKVQYKLLMAVTNGFFFLLESMAVGNRKREDQEKENKRIEWDAAPKFGMNPDGDVVMKGEGTDITPKD